jgi:hypothetical protein
VVLREPTEQMDEVGLQAAIGSWPLACSPNLMTGGDQDISFDLCSKSVLPACLVVNISPALANEWATSMDACLMPVYL